LFKRGRYYYFWYWDGDARRRKSTGKTTLSEARLFQQQFLRNQPSSGLLKAYLAGWFIADTCPWTQLRRLSGASVSDDYLENRRGYVDNYIIPAFGDRQMHSITSQEIQSWLYALNLSNQTRKHIYTTLNDIFEYSIAHDDIRSNPMSGVRTPVVSSKGVRGVFTQDEARKLVLAAQGVSRKAYLALWILWSTGIRSGELRSLYVSDVLSKPQPALWVRKAMKRHGVVGETKTEQSFRVVPLVQPLHKELIDYVATQELHQEDRIFPVAKETVSWWVRKALEIAGIPKGNRSAHSLRHTFVSQMKGSIDQQQLFDVTGHSSAASTTRYDQRWVEQRLDQLTPVRGVADAVFVLSRDAGS
jgi:integrase